MKIFATVDYPFSGVLRREEEPTCMAYGAWEVNDSFYTALLRYGRFEEYRFLIQNPKNVEIFKQRATREGICLRKVKFFPLRQAEGLIKGCTVLFSSSTRIAELARLRARYVKTNFPVCGFTHTISYRHMLRDVFFEELTAGLMPFDTRICSSISVCQAARNLYRLVSDSLQKGAGINLSYPGRLDILPLGLECGSFAKTPREIARRKLLLPEGKKIILYFGRVSLYDKADLFPLLAVLKEIVKKEKNALLVIAGTDGDEKYGLCVKGLAEKMGLSAYTKFILHNYLTLTEKEMLYSAADIFVSPVDNIQESFGLTVIEAMASGLAVVAADWDGYKQSVRHNRSGFLVPTYWADCIEAGVFDGLSRRWKEDHLFLAQSVCVDKGKLRNYLLRLLCNSELRQRFGRYAQEVARKEYDWKKIIPRYEKLWEELFRLSQKKRLIRARKYLFAPDYFACFKHYPSRVLQGREKLCVTNRGSLLLEKRQLDFAIPMEIEAVVSLRIIFLVLSFLSSGSSSIGRIKRFIRSIFTSASKEQVGYIIMWMLKKDLLELASE